MQQDFINSICGMKNSYGAHVEVTRDEDFWKKTGFEASTMFGPTGFASEVVHNFYESRFDLIKIKIAHPKSFFSTLITGHGNGIPLKDEEYQSLLLKERVDGKKSIGIHRGEGEQKAASGEIYDKENGYYYRGHIETDAEGHKTVHFIIWDGKGVSCVGNHVFILNLEDVPFRDEIKDCKAFAGLTESNFTTYGDTTDAADFEEKIRMNMAPAINKGNVKLYISVNGHKYREITAYDVELSEVIDRLPEEFKNNPHTYNVKVYHDDDGNEIRFKGLNLISVSRSEYWSEIEPLIPDCYRDKKGEVNIDKILLKDDHYIYHNCVIKNLFISIKDFATYDTHTLLIIEADRNFWGKFAYNSCKLMGLKEPFGGKSPLAKSLPSIRLTVANILRQGHASKNSIGEIPSKVEFPSSTKYSFDNSPERGEIAVLKIDDKKDECNGTLCTIVPKSKMVMSGMTKCQWEDSSMAILNGVKNNQWEIANTIKKKSEKIAVQKFLREYYSSLSSTEA